MHKSAELGGVYSAEHGTGKRKRADFLECFGNDGIEQVRISKAALDPDFLLNSEFTFIYYLVSIFLFSSLFYYLFEKVIIENRPNYNK